MSAITSKSFEILNHFILPLQMLEVQTSIISSNRYNIHRPQIQPYAGMLSFHIPPFQGTCLAVIFYHPSGPNHQDGMFSNAISGLVRVGQPCSTV